MLSTAFHQLYSSFLTNNRRRLELKRVTRLRRGELSFFFFAGNKVARRPAEGFGCLARVFERGGGGGEVVGFCCMTAP